MAGEMHFPETLIALVAVIYSGPIIWIVAFYTWQVWKTWNEVALKRDMVARGYTAQEIVQVVGAMKGSKYSPVTDTPPAKPVKAALGT